MLAAFQFLFIFLPMTSYLRSLMSNHQCIEHHIIFIVHYNDKHFEKLQAKGLYPRSFPPPP